MSLVLVERYRSITGDTATSATLVEDLLDEAVELLEERLRRPIAEERRTEEMRPDRRGVLWPKATPIVSAPGWTIVGVGLCAGVFGGSPFDQHGLVEVTYTGGWVERSANPTAPNRLPAHIERDIAWAARTLSTPQLAEQARQIHAGATSVRVGDVALSFGAGGSSTGLSPVRWSPETLRYRWRPPHGSN